MFSLKKIKNYLYILIQDAFIKELDELHEKRELCLMERGNKLSNYETQLSQAKCFVDRVTEHGHAGQVAQLLQTMMNQLNNLCMGFIIPDVPAATEFKSDATTFSTAVKSYFGYFSKQKGLKVCIFGDNLLNSKQNRKKLRIME